MAPASRPRSIRIFSVTGSLCILVPPARLVKQFQYHCGRAFQIDPAMFPLEEAPVPVKESKGECKAEEPPFVGIALVSGSTNLFYRVNLHAEVKLVAKFDEVLPNRHRRGGQSSARFGRLADAARERHVGRIVEHITQQAAFCSNGTRGSCVRLVLAGPADTKRKVAEHALIKQMFKDAVTVLDTAEVQETQSILALEKEHVPGWIREAKENVDNVPIRMVDECMQDAPKIDRLLFGIDECTNSMDNLQFLLVAGETGLEKQVSKSTQVTVLAPQHAFVKRFGNCVGIKWW